MPGVVTAYTMGFPPGWASWTVGRGVETADAVAAKAADGPDAQELVRRGVLGLESLCEQEGLFFAAALWVPDRSTGETAATARLELLTGPREVEASYEDALQKARHLKGERGFKIFDRAVEEMTVPAGRAFAEVTMLAERSAPFGRSKGPARVESRVQITFFPPGCSEVLSLLVMTVDPTLTEAIAEAAHAAADSLTVTVGPPSTP